MKTEAFKLIEAAQTRWRAVNARGNSSNEPTTTKARNKTLAEIQEIHADEYGGSRHYDNTACGVCAVETEPQPTVGRGRDHLESSLCGPPRLGRSRELRAVRTSRGGDTTWMCST